MKVIKRLYLSLQWIVIITSHVIERTTNTTSIFSLFHHLIIHHAFVFLAFEEAFDKHVVAVRRQLRKNKINSFDKIMLAK